MSNRYEIVELQFAVHMDGIAQNVHRTKDIFIVIKNWISLNRQLSFMSHC